MRPVFLFWAMVCLVLVLGMAVPVLAEGPTEQIKQTTDKAIALLSDPTLRDPARAEERRTLLRKIADERFDWEEMARRALARYWKERTEEEKREFVSLFSDLLERTYMKRIEGYSGEKVLYEEETVDESYGTVRAKVLTETDTEISVEYRVKLKNGEWLIYDVIIEGVSLVNNYRTQFNTILLKSSYPKLVERLRAKTEQS
jgi:phospholipid transport system substrate-binding protein